MPLRAHTTTTPKFTVTNPSLDGGGAAASSTPRVSWAASQAKHECFFVPSLVSQHQASALSTTLHIPHGRS